MPEHFTKNTVMAVVWCKRCWKNTPHRIDDGRRGPCLTCLARREAESELFTKYKPVALFPELEPPEQLDLFSGQVP